MAQSCNYILLCCASPYYQASLLPLLYDASLRQPDRTFAVVTRPESMPLFVEPPERLQVMPYDSRAEGLLAFAQRLHRTYPQAAVVDLVPTATSYFIRTILRLRGHKVGRPLSLKRIRRSLERAARSNPHDQLPGMHLFYAQTMRRAGIDVGAGTLILRNKRERSIGIALTDEHVQTSLPHTIRETLMARLDQAFPGYRVLEYGVSDEKRALTIDSDRTGRIEWGGTFADVGAVHSISTLSCMVSVDSVYQHIAAMVGVPVVTLWTKPGPILAYRPYRAPKENSIEFAAYQHRSVEELVERLVENVRRVLTE